MEATTERDQSEFLFRGGLISLELVNTAIAVRGKPVDLLVDPEALARWWIAVGQRYPTLMLDTPPEAYTVELLIAAKALRDTLRRVFDAVTHNNRVAEEDLAAINQVIATAHLTLVVGPDTKWQQTFCPNEPGDSMVLFQVALSAMQLLTERDIARLHKCRNERCVLYFYDTTKSATRQWCSSECQNRERSIHNYRRRKTDLAKKQP